MHNPVVHFEMLSKDPAKLSNGGGASCFETLALLSTNGSVCRIHESRHLPATAFGDCPLEVDFRA
jgi:hypothetical protein